jgi:hypothetical protein
VTTRDEAARQAYSMTLAQLGRLRTGDLDAYFSSEAELADIYRDMLDFSQQPAAGLAQDEFEATTRELANVQQVICAEIDSLLQQAADALASQRRRRAVTGAYGVTLPPPTPRGA